MRKFGIPIIEDCSHGFSIERSSSSDLITSYNLLGDASIFSLYATKLLPGGEGGMIMTNSDALAGYSISYRDYTDLPPSPWRLNYKMSDIHAALARQNLSQIDFLIDQRQWLANRYNQLLQPCDLFALSIQSSSRVWYRYILYLTSNSASSVIDQLACHQVCACRPVDQWCKTQADMHPSSHLAFTHAISLPLFVGLDHSQVDLIVSSLLSGLT